MTHAPARVAKPGSRVQKQGLSVTKWSLDETPPSEDAIRVRNNQRRHRERVKTYIADLEAKVAALEADLCTANGQIEKLTRENEDLRRTKEEPQLSPENLSPHQPTISPNSLRPIHPPQEVFTAPEKVIRKTFCCRREPSDGADEEISDREDLPPPLEGESTTNCETAYRMLEQQSEGRLDTDTAEQFLRPGYRRALRHGEGCRVQTQLVYGLLDRLTS